MTDLDRFRATCEHRRPDRLLYHASFTPDLHERMKRRVGDDVGAALGFRRSISLTPRLREGVGPIDYSSYWEDEHLPEGTSFNPFGVARVPSGYYHFYGYVSPLRHATSLREIEDYPLPNPDDWDFTHLPAEVERAHADGRIVLAGVGHMYETAWQIRGYEPFLVDMIERPAWAECLLERIITLNRVKARAFAGAGADMIMCGDDVANQNALMFSPTMWYEMHHKRWARLWREVKSIRPEVRIWYHSDGNIEAILPQLVDSGLDILNPLQPECMDLEAVHRRFGDRLTFDGCVGTQSTMPWGTAAEVRDCVRSLVERFGRQGGLMIAPTHVLEPEVPEENVLAFAEACRQFGRLN